MSSVEDLLQAAEARTRLAEWGDDWFLDPLAASVEDLDSDHLNDAGRSFLVLKAPQVANHLPAFSTVFPEARFLVTVRDPYRVFASGHAMVGGIVDAFITEGFEPPDPFPIENLERTLRSLLDFHVASPDLMMPIGYPELVADPGLDHDQVLARPTVSAFCDHFGVVPERARLTGAHP